MHYLPTHPDPLTIAAHLISSGWPKEAVDAQDLYGRVFGAGRVQDVTGQIPKEHIGQAVINGAARSVPSVPQARALATAPSLNPQGEVIRNHYNGPMSAGMEEARALGRTSMVHPTLAPVAVTGWAGMPMPSPAGQSAMSGVIGAHEIAERRVNPRDMVAGYAGHMSPDVLLQEHNTLSRLTGDGAGEAVERLRGMRNFSGEAPHLRESVERAFNDPRAGQFLNEGEKVPRAMRKAFRAKVRANPLGILGSGPAQPAASAVEKAVWHMHDLAEPIARGARHLI